MDNVHQYTTYMYVGYTDLDEVGEGVHHVLVRLPDDAPEAVAILRSAVHRQATRVGKELDDALDVFLAIRRRAKCGKSVHFHYLSTHHIVSSRC